MMNAIRNFAEAKLALQKIHNLSQEVESFIVSMEQRIDAVAALKADVGQPDLPLENPPITMKAPETWNDRVLCIFKDSKVPLRQREVASIYEGLGWPSNYAHNLYATISGSIAYLNRKGTLIKTDGGYKLAQQS